MEKYHKINSVFKRDDKGNFTSEFSQPEFEYLFDNEWIGTEKIDGTNIRIHWIGEAKQTSYWGRTDGAQIPEHLLKHLLEIHFPFDEVFGEQEVTLFGEGYGRKIQKVGSSYISDGVDFILFDIKIGPYWLRRSDVVKLSMQLGIKVVPTIVYGKLSEMIDFIKNGFQSKVAESELQAEGLVLTPKVPLYNHMGRRVITKLKTKDFE